MPEEAVSQHVLQYKTDEASVAASVQAVERIKASFAETNKAVADVTAEGSRLQELFRTQGAEAVRLQGLIANLNDEYRAGQIGLGEYESESARLSTALNKADQAFGDTTLAIREADNAIKSFYKDTQAGADQVASVEPAQATRSIKLQTVGYHTRNITGLIGALGGGELAGQLNLGAELMEAAGGAKELASQLPKMTNQLAGAVGGVGNLAMAGGAVAVAVTGLYLAVDMLGEKAEASRRKVQAEIEFEKRRAEILAETKTTAGLREEIQALSDASAARQAEIDRLKEDRKAHHDTYNALEQLGEETGIYNQGLDDLDKQIHTLISSQEADIKLRKELINSIREGATAYKDFWTQATNEAEDYLGVQEKLREFYAMTSDELNESMQENIAQAKAYESAPGVGRIIQGFYKALEEGTSFMGLGESLTGPANLVESDLEKLAQALIDQDDPMGQLLMNYVKLKREFDLMTSSTIALSVAQNDAAAAAENLKDYTEEQAEAVAKRNQQAERDQEDFERDRLNDLADHYQDMAQLDVDYYADVEDLLEDLADDLGGIDQEKLDEIKDYNKESQRLAEDHQDRLKEIQEDANFNFSEAARRRDAVAALAALRQGEKALKDENDQYAKEQARREEDFKDLLVGLEAEKEEKKRAAAEDLRDLEEQHRKEEAAKEAAFAEQLRRKDAERAIQLQRQQQDWANEDLARATHYGVIETATSTHYSNLLGRTITGTANIENAWSASLARMAAAAGAYTGSDGTTGAASGGATKTYGFGGTPPIKTPVIFGERNKAETAVFAGGQREIVGKSGAELAMVTKQARIYPSANAVTPVQVNLGGLGVNVTFAPGASAQNMAQQTMQQFEPLFLRCFEKLVNEYESGR